MFSITVLALRQPQLRVLPDSSGVWPTMVVFPQSQRHRQTVVPFADRSPVGSSATSRPNRCPDKSFCPGLTFVTQPQSNTVPRWRARGSSRMVPPQVHRHSQTVYPFFRSSVLETTVRFPIR